jgi:hypothetical protein
MNRKSFSIAYGALCAGAVFAIVAVSSAHAADGVRVRGTVVSLAGTTLTVKTREGATSALVLKDGWKLTGLARAAVNDIKPGDFVGVASLPKAAGGDGALEVLIFPAALRMDWRGQQSLESEAVEHDDQRHGVEHGQGRRWTDLDPFLPRTGEEDVDRRRHADRDLRSRDTGRSCSGRDSVYSGRSRRRRRACDRIRCRRHKWRHAANVTIGLSRRARALAKRAAAALRG